MKPVEFYQNLLAQIDEEDLRAVARVMLEHIGMERAIALPELARAAFGEYNVSTERKARILLEELVTRYHWPVGAHSGKPGRWLCENNAELDQVIRDLEARRNALDERIRALRSAIWPRTLPSPSRQRSLWS